MTTEHDLDPAGTGDGPRPAILLVEDDPDDTRMAFQALRGRYDPVHARRASEALEAVHDRRFGLVVVDYRLPDMSGVELCRRLRDLGLSAPILMTSSVESDDVVSRALRAGATEFLVKHLKFPEHLEREVGRLVGD